MDLLSFVLGALFCNYYTQGSVLSLGFRYLWIKKFKDVHHVGTVHHVNMCTCKKSCQNYHAPAKNHAKMIHAPCTKTTKDPTYFFLSRARTHLFKICISFCGFTCSIYACSQVFIFDMHEYPT